MQLRYGVNPHQEAVWAEPGPLGLVSGDPSYVNLLDAINAWRLVHEVRETLGTPTAASFKHVSPAGAAIAGPLDDVMRANWRITTAEPSPLATAYLRARDTDPKSSFGDMIAVSDPVDADLVEVLTGVIADGIVAPGFSEGAVGALARKKHGRFVIFDIDPEFEPPARETREISGLTVVQDTDQRRLTANDLTTIEKASAANQRDALLGLITVRHTQSNSVAYVRDGMTIGIGAGQQSRVDCTRLAGSKADVWWLRRHPAIRGLSFPRGHSRQDQVNWRIRLAEGEMTTAQRRALAAVIAGEIPELTTDQRVAWLAQQDDVTVAHDGFIPFRDNVDHAARHGVRHIVAPGGSIRSAEVAEACREQGISLSEIPIRLFHH
jgi:phosphoribosylaminoimidazolecarboxamide formyltransferase/IMP cyclohydrolase